MKIWFDTEFLENGRTIDLISIGMVREDGATFYAETPQAEGLTKSNDWLRANVLPQLRGWDGRERSQIADDIVAFAGEKPEFWAYYADYDWVALCQLYGTMMDLPKGWPMFCLDLKQKAHVIGNPRLPEQAKGEHNALDDALWAKHAWSFLCGLEACDREALEDYKARLADAHSKNPPEAERHG